MDDHQFQAIRRSMRQLRWMLATQFVMLLVILVFLADRIFPT